MTWMLVWVARPESAKGVVRRLPTPFADSELVKKWGLAPAIARKTWEFSSPGQCLSPFFHKLSGRATPRQPAFLRKRT